MSTQLQEVKVMLIFMPPPPFQRRQGKLLCCSLSVGRLVGPSTVSVPSLSKGLGEIEQFLIELWFVDVMFICFSEVAHLGQVVCTIEQFLTELAPWTKKIQLLAFRSISLQMFNNVITDISWITCFAKKCDVRRQILLNSDTWDTRSLFVNLLTSYLIGLCISDCTSRWRLFISMYTAHNKGLYTL